MTALKAHEVERFVKRPDLREGIILAYGPDSGLVRESAEKLAKHYAGPGGMGLITLEGAELDADPGRLLVEARTSSLFAEQRIIRVRNGGKSLVVPLSALAEEPSGSIVILEAGNLTPKDALRALVETAKTGRTLPCYADSAETILKLIQETFATAGIRLEADVAPTLRDTLGNDRDITRRELEKLALYAAESKVLTRADVLTLCADNATLALDEISDAVGTGRVGDLDDAMSRALAASINPQQILFAVNAHFLALRRWRILVDAGDSARQVLESARPKPHFSRKDALETQLRLWSDSALSSAADRLQTATSDSRKTYAMAETIVRRALLGIARQAAEH